MTGRPGHRGFGHIRKLPSGKLQARYVGPDLRRYTAAATFCARVDAEAWLVGEQALIAKGAWISPPARAAEKARQETRFGHYAEKWVRE